MHIKDKSKPHASTKSIKTLQKTIPQFIKSLTYCLYALCGKLRILKCIGRINYRKFYKINTKYLY